MAGIETNLRHLYYNSYVISDPENSGEESRFMGLRDPSPAEAAQGFGVNLKYRILV